MKLYYYTYIDCAVSLTPVRLKPLISSVVEIMAFDELVEAEGIQ